MLLPEEQTMLSFPTDTANPIEPVPIFYLHEGEQAFCATPGCICKHNAPQLRKILLDIITGQLKLRLHYHGVVRMEGNRGTP